MVLNWKYLVLFPGIFILSACSDNVTKSSPEIRTFTNPVVSDGADPWVIKHENYYLYCFSTGDKIWISKTNNLHEIGTADPVLIWQPEKGQMYSENLWAPELHYIDGKWYVYVAADNGMNTNHRMYVLENPDTNPLGNYVLKGKISDSIDRWAIDGTVLEHNEKLYFLWSGWAGTTNVQQNLYIAPMSNPWTINGDRILISEPEYSWEIIGNPLINEGPEVLIKNGIIHIIYSASGSWTGDYCLGQLTFTGTDILSRKSWSKKNQPVFAKTDSVFGPGHASFVASPDGREDWIIYHAAKRKGSGWDRNIRMQKFEWNEDHSPDFGCPVPVNIPLSLPSGSENH